MSTVCISQSIDSSLVINGVLYEPDLNIPITQAIVQIVNPKFYDNPARFITAPDSNGCFTLRPWWPGTYRIKVTGIDIPDVISAPIILSVNQRTVYLQLAISLDYDDEIDRFKIHPSSWKKIDAEGKFVFYLPRGFKGECSLLGDSFHGKFSNDSVTVGFDDAGMSFSPPNRNSISTTKVIAGCRRAYLTFINFNQTNSNFHFRFVSSLDFRGWNKLTLYVAYNDYRFKDAANRILLSIQFKD